MLVDERPEDMIRISYKADVVGSIPTAPTVKLQVSGTIDGPLVRILTVDCSSIPAAIGPSHLNIDHSAMRSNAAELHVD
ncbi:MAG TPA: hypothetical protein VL551_11300 [Actinospica sp.]|jgi:hypothetical protein|nr:hypothetical protein [Actinospica sp.]